MALQRPLAQTDIVAALGYDPQILLQTEEIIVGGTDRMTTAWNAAAASLSSSVGVFSSASATNRWKKVGRLLHLQAAILVTTAGTAGGTIGLILPFAAAVNCALSGVQANTGKAVVAALTATSTLAVVTLYDGSFPGGSGADIRLHGVYETVT